VIRIYDHIPLEVSWREILFSISISYLMPYNNSLAGSSFASSVEWYGICEGEVRIGDELVASEVFKFKLYLGGVDGDVEVLAAKR
jgi:hypothetical protein